MPTRNATVQTVAGPRVLRIEHNNGQFRVFTQWEAKIGDAVVTEVDVQEGLAVLAGDMAIAEATLLTKLEAALDGAQTRAGY